MLCPCKSEKEYAQCCEPFIAENQLPDTPEQLMRSRYTAYTQANIDYIIATMKDAALKDFDKASAKQWAESVTWVKLKVLHAYIDSAIPDTGFVEFKAYYRYKKQMHVMHEFSEFKKLNHQWFYVGAK
jgi:SEC-C motif-containing protein